MGFMRDIKEIKTKSECVKKNDGSETALVSRTLLLSSVVAPDSENAVVQRLRPGIEYYRFPNLTSESMRSQLCQNCVFHHHRFDSSEEEPT